MQCFEPMFSYSTAFDRNLGWVTETEQQVLRAKKIAIAGLGASGGAHLLTLTRLGIGGFHLADFDHFELQHFNRQVGRPCRSIGRPKIDVMSEMALGINPELQIKKFETGVDAGKRRSLYRGRGSLHRRARLLRARRAPAALQPVCGARHPGRSPQRRSEWVPHCLSLCRAG
jgi:hypothetical protein